MGGGGGGVPLDQTADSIIMARGSRHAKSTVGGLPHKMPRCWKWGGWGGVGKNQQKKNWLNLKNFVRWGGRRETVPIKGVQKRHLTQKIVL